MAAPQQPTLSPGLGDAPDDVSQWSLIKRMFGLAWRYRWGCIKVLSLGLFLQLTIVVGLALIGIGIDVVRYTAAPSEGKLPHYPWGLAALQRWPGMTQVMIIAGLIVAVAILRAIVERRNIVEVGELVHRGIVVDMRSQVYDKLQRLSFRFFDNNDTGSIINRVTGDVQRVGMFINGVVLQAVNLFLGMAIAVAYMLDLSPFLTAVTLASTPILLLTCVRFARTVKPAYRESQRLVDRLIITLAEHLQGIHVVKGFARHEQEIAKFEHSNKTVADQRKWIFWKVSLFNPVILLLTQINIVVLLIVGGYLVIQGRLAVGSGLVVFAGLLQQFSNNVAALANITNTIQVSLTSAQRVFEIMDAPIEIANKPNAIKLADPKGMVRFEHVSFGYKSDELVLEDIDFEVPAGSCVAILGATGAGKSTLMSLLARFYDPTHGSIYIDGINLRDIEVDSLRRSIGLVFQESFLFSNTLAANIAFGHPEATREQIEKAAKIAAAHDFIMELPQGYDTVIGENGADLSGGQRQRLAIARAVLLEPAILILDDATAAIDPQTEHEILRAMDNAIQGRTTFMVAHRLSTLRKADMVIVLEKGRIVQRGTHDQLMSTRGHYRRAARLQTADAQSKRLLGLSNRHSA